MIRMAGCDSSEVTGVAATVPLLSIGLSGGCGRTESLLRTVLTVPLAAHDREHNPELGTTVGGVTRMNLTMVSLNDGLYDRQTQAGPSTSTAPATFAAPETLEHPIARVLGQPMPVIADLEHGPTA
jgi:hypothetical protein